MATQPVFSFTQGSVLRTILNQEDIKELMATPENRECSTLLWTFGLDGIVTGLEVHVAKM